MTICPPVGAVCAAGALPLPGLSVVSAGQERTGRGVLVCAGHGTSVQQTGQCGSSFVPLVHQTAQPSESTPVGEVDQCGRGQCTQQGTNHQIRKRDKT